MSNLNQASSHKIFLAITCLLAAAPIFKLGDVQLLEVFFVLHLLWLTLRLGLQSFRVSINKLWRRLGVCYAFFFVMTLLLAFASLRFRFYPPEGADSFLKQPFVLSLARSFELFLGVFHMLYIASILSQSAEERTFAVRFYFWTGFGTACYTLLSIPVNIALGLNLGVYFPNLRGRGFFNEGGPYGLYLLTIIISGLLLYQIRKMTTRSFLVAAFILIPVFLMTQSKSAISACGFLFLLNIFIAGSLRIRVSLSILSAALIIGILTLSNFIRDFSGYINAYFLIQQVGSLIDQSAYGGFGGRVAGAILVPRMIMAHPVTGIGLGNYPLLFNDPHYLQGLPATSNWEAPSMGIVGYLADFGVPLFLLLLVFLCIPVWMAYRNKSLSYILIFTAVQPLTHLFGVQLNFYYPWICSGLALSFLSWQE